MAIEDELEVAAHRMSDDERDAFARMTEMWIFAPTDGCEPPPT